MKNFFLTLLPIFLVSCANKPKEQNKYISPYEKNLISYSSLFKQNKDNYYVYFYSPYCTVCSYLQDVTHSYFENKNPDNMFVVDLYFESEDGLKFIDEGDYENLLNCDNLDSFYLIYTPVLFKFNDAKITQIFDTYDDIASFFS